MRIYGRAGGYILAQMSVSSHSFPHLWSASQRIGDRTRRTPEKLKRVHSRSAYYGELMMMTLSFAKSSSFQAGTAVARWSASHHARIPMSGCRQEGKRRCR